MRSSQEPSILLKGGSVLIHDNNNHVHPQTLDILIETNLITKIAETIERGADTKLINCHGKIIGPGFIDTHRHLYQTPLKGKHGNHTIVNYFPSGNFTAALYDTQDLFWGQLAGAMESIDAGTTTVVDHSSCNLTPDHPSAAIQALLTSGLRSVYCYTPPRKVNSWNPWKLEDDHFSEETTTTFRKLARAAPFGNDTVHIGHSIDNLYLPPEDLKSLYADLRDPAKGKAKLITTHALGGPIVGNAPSAAQMLAKHGLLGADILLSHANFPRDGDADLYTKSGAHVSCTPSTELQMGFPPVALRDDHYEHASLGVDCHSWTSASIPTQGNVLLHYARCKRQEELAAKGMWSKDIGFNVEQVFNLGTVGGAKAAGLGNEVGKIAVGMKADLLVFDTTSPAMLAAAQEDPVAAVLLHSTPRDIETVIVDGVVRKEGGRLVDVRVEAQPNGSKGLVDVGRRLRWEDVADRVLESRKVLKERLLGIDMEEGEEYCMDMFHFNKGAMVEAAGGFDSCARFA